MIFPNKFNKFSNTGAWMQNFIYLLPRKLHLNHNFGIQTSVSPLEFLDVNV